MHGNRPSLIRKRTKQVCAVVALHLDRHRRLLRSSQPPGALPLQTALCYPCTYSHGASTCCHGPCCFLGGPLRRAAAATPSLQRCCCCCSTAVREDEMAKKGAPRGAAGGRGGRRGGGGQHVPHRRRRGRRARRDGLPHTLLAQGHVPRVRRRWFHPQVRQGAAGERGEEGRGPDRLPQLQRARQARPDRQVALHSTVRPSAHQASITFFLKKLNKSLVYICMCCCVVVQGCVKCMHVCMSSCVVPSCMLSTDS